MKTMWQTAKLQRMQKEEAAKRRARKERRERQKAVSVFKQYGKPPAYKPNMGSEFYLTKEWRSLRWEVLSTSDGSCVMCGATRKSSGVPMHVDHIRPRSQYPHLELTKSNMQVLCEACNMGKGSQTWSPPDQPSPFDARQDKPKWQRSPVNINPRS